MATKKICWRSFDWGTSSPLAFPCNRNIFVSVKDIREYVDALITASAKASGVSEKSIVNRNWEFFKHLKELAKREDVSLWKQLPSDDWDLGWLEESLVLPFVEWHA